MDKMNPRKVSKCPKNLQIKHVSVRTCYNNNSERRVLPVALQVSFIQERNKNDTSRHFNKTLNSLEMTKIL